MACRLAGTDKGDGMDTLSELGLKYGTDKIGKHNYLPIYYDLFKDRRNEVKKVLEIGVGEGKGLRMFRDFFPKAMIFGLEIDVDRLFQEDRIDVIYCNQSDKNDLLYGIGCIGTDIDLVVDDGSHKPEDQVFTFNVIFPNLNEGAIYIIEDVADENVFNLLFECKKKEIKKVGRRYDDRLIICRK